MSERSREGNLDAESTWRRFESLAATSEQSPLQGLSATFAGAPEEARLALVEALAQLLSPVEWPSSWQGPRMRLATALDALARETSPDVIALELTLDEADLYAAGLRDLVLARDWLAAPCRRDDLPMVAQLCNFAHFARWQAAGRALLRLGPRAKEASFAKARRRYAIAFSNYVEAARAMNNVCGAALFHGFDLDLRDEKEA